MKRSSPEGSDDPDDSQAGYEDATKRRRCEFESVRLLSVSGVVSTFRNRLIKNVAFSNTSSALKMTLILE